MQKNAFFAPFSSMLGNHGNNEALVPSSDTSTELHINYNRTFFPTTQLCDGFQLTGFSQPNQKLAKPTPSPGGFTMTPVSGYKGGGRSDTVTGSGTQSRIDFKLMLIGDPMEEAAILGTHGAKRHKASPGGEKHHFPCLSSESALIQTQTPSRRSQKLGDKITALQQLVSPFGKTDTASVLHEATVCIKVLHEQIQVLSSPYFRSNPLACQQEHDEQSEGLRSRGLCLVPVSHIINLSDHAASPIGSRSP